MPAVIHIHIILHEHTVYMKSYAKKNTYLVLHSDMSKILQ